MLDEKGRELIDNDRIDYDFRATKEMQERGKFSIWRIQDSLAKDREFLLFLDAGSGMCSLSFEGKIEGFEGKERSSIGIKRSTYDALYDDLYRHNKNNGNHRTIFSDPVEERLFREYEDFKDKQIIQKKEI